MGSLLHPPKASVSGFHGTRAAKRVPDDILGHVDAVLSQHGVEDPAHGVLGGLGGQHAHAVGHGIVVKHDPRQHAEVPGMVLGLETEVALHVDFDHGIHPRKPVLDLGNVLANERELLGRLCNSKPKLENKEFETTAKSQRFKQRQRANV